MKSYLLLLFFLFPFVSPAANDTLILQLKDLHYTSSIEQTAFESMNGIPIQDKLNFALAIDSILSNQKLEQAKTRLDNMFAYFDKQKIKEKPIEKSLKIIHDYLEENFFTKYEPIADLSQTFDKGIYNCVSGTIMYAIIFDHYEMVFEIRESANHVKIVLDPTNKAIVVESTDPLKGYYMYNAQEINKYINSLIELNIISKDEIKDKNNADLLSEYINKDKKIGYKELVSFQYSNKSVLAREGKSYLYAKELIEKAYYLYPNKVNESFYLISALAAIEVTKVKYDQIILSFKLKNSYPKVLNEYLSNKYREYGYDILIKKSDYKGYMKFHDEVQPLLKDSLLTEEITNLHNQLLAYYYSYKQDYSNALSYFHYAVKYSPNDLELKSDMQNAFLRLLASYEILEEEDEYNEDSIIFSWMSILDSNPSLLENIAIKNIAGEFKEYNEYRLYYVDFNKINEADIKSTMESKVAIIKEHNKDDIEEANDLIAELYHELSLYYFRKKNYDKTRESLLIAIKYDPNNTTYKNRYEDMKGYK